MGRYIQERPDYICLQKKNPQMATKPPSRVAIIKKTVNVKCW